MADSIYGGKVIDSQMLERNPGLRRLFSTLGIDYTQPAVNRGMSARPTMPRQVAMQPSGRDGLFGDIDRQDALANVMNLMAAEQGNPVSGGVWEMNQAQRLANERGFKTPADMELATSMGEIGPQADAKKRQDRELDIKEVLGKASVAGQILAGSQRGIGEQQPNPAINSFLASLGYEVPEQVDPRLEGVKQGIEVIREGKDKEKEEQSKGTPGGIASGFVPGTPANNQLADALSRPIEDPMGYLKDLGAVLPAASLIPGTEANRNTTMGMMNALDSVTGPIYNAGESAIDWFYNWVKQEREKYLANRNAQ